MTELLGMGKIDVKPFIPTGQQVGKPFVPSGSSQPAQQSTTTEFKLDVNAKPFVFSGSAPVQPVPAADPDYPTRISADECIGQLKQQIAWYLSHENLANDLFLLSQMTVNIQCPAAVLFHFPRIQKITTDWTMFVRGIRASGVFFDENYMLVGPRYRRLQKQTLILRHVAPDASEADVRALLGPSPAPTGLTQHVAGIWHVTFRSTDDATTVFERHHVAGIRAGDRIVTVNFKMVMPLQIFLDEARAAGLPVVPFDPRNAVPPWAYRGHAPRRTPTQTNRQAPTRDDRHRAPKSQPVPRDQAKSGAEREAAFPALNTLLVQ